MFLLPNRSSVLIPAPEFSATTADEQFVEEPQCFAACEVPGEYPLKKEFKSPISSVPSTGESHIFRTLGRLNLTRASHGPLAIEASLDTD